MSVSGSAEGLSVEGLRVTYRGVCAVEDVALDVRPGRCVALVGANGAGKTSTLHGIGGLVPAARDGRIRLNGKAIHGMPAPQRARLGLGHVLENRHVFPHLSVRQNLELGAGAARGRTSEVGISDAYELLPELTELRNRPAGTLSGGQQQFLAIGRALAGGPTVLMLDEPTNGLAPMLVERVIEIVRAIRTRGVGVLLVEQRLEVAQAVGDEIRILQHGQLVHTTTRDDPDLPELVHAAYLGRELA